MQKKRSSFALGLLLGIDIVHCLALLIPLADTYTPVDRPVPISIIGGGLAGSYLLFEGFGNIKRLKQAEKSAQRQNDSSSS